MVATWKDILLRWPSRRAVLVAAMVLVAATGWWAAKRRSATTDNEARERLLSRAVAIAQTINPNLARDLTFTEADLGHPAFQRIRDQLTAYGKFIPQRGIYSMALREGAIVFGPETYPEGDPLASLPGTPYAEPSPEVWACFASRRSVVVGPYRDEYGAFVSALAPVLDPLSGEILMVVGLDVLAADWQAAVSSARRGPIVGTVLLLALLLGGLAGMEWRDRLSANRQLRLRHLETGLVGTIGMVLALTGTLLVMESERRERWHIFDKHADMRTDAFREALLADAADLACLAFLFDGHEHVARQKFSAFAEPLARVAAIQAYAWAAAVPAEQREHFEAEARRQGLTDFVIWELDGQGQRVPAADRAVYYPLSYVAPEADHRIVVGFDLGSESKRRDAIGEAMRTGLVTASEPITLIRKTGLEPGILIIRPVFAKGDDHAGENETEAAKPAKGVRGFVVGALGLQSTFDQALRRYEHEGSLVEMHWVDLTVDEPAALLATHPRAHLDGHVSTLHPHLHAEQSAHLVHPVFAFGRAFAVVSHPTAAFEARYPMRTGWLAGFGGVFLTGVLTTFVGFMRNRQIALEQAVTRRTAALRAEQQFAQATVDALSLHIAILDETGKVLAVNKRWKEFTETYGGCLHRIMSTIDCSARCAQATEECAAGALVFETEVRAVMRRERESFEMEYVCRALDQPRWFRMGVTRFEGDGAARIVVAHADITEQKAAAAQIEAMHRELLEASRQAGMAEIASGVLHNVGNVLNSVNVSAELVAEKVRHVRLPGLSKAVGMMQTHMDDPESFFAGGGQGRPLVDYIAQLAEHFTAEQAAVIEELSSLTRNIEHIKSVVNMQQAYARSSSIVEPIDLGPLVEDALRLSVTSFEQHGIQVVRAFEEVPQIRGDRQKLLQILVNLVRNAKHALQAGSRSDKRLTIHLGRSGEDRVCIKVNDNGVGIPRESLPRIFTHGFTTKKRGHGLGLHNSAILVKAMQGTLTAQSGGEGQGATFTLDLPVDMMEERV